MAQKRSYKYGAWYQNIKKIEISDYPQEFEISGNWISEESETL